MPNITPCLWFDHQAEDAVHFYLGIFPNSRELEILRYGEAGPGPASSVLIVRFDLDGREISALNGGPAFPHTPAISLVVPSETQSEVDRYWDLLSDGGETSQCGWPTDRFGVSWQIVPNIPPKLLSDPDPGKAARAMRAMLGMTRLDIAEMVRAHAG